MTSFAQSISLNEAREVAKNQLLMAGISNAKLGTSKSGALKLVPLKRENIQLRAAKAEVESKDTLYYVLNDSVNNAFVIVSADKRAWPILAYSLHGTFNKDKQPEAFVSWMENRKKEIAYIKENNLQADNQTSIKWEQLRSLTRAAQTSGVEPLLKTTWNQGCYYNELCPADAQGDCGHTWTGCTATAMAQIMKYWNYPEKGTGAYSYIDSKYGRQFADFGASTYNWVQMPNTLTSQNSEVAKLIFHCGVSISSWYSVEGTGAFGENIPDALARYFSYSKNIRSICKGITNNENWISLLKQELDWKRPIIYCGSGSGGHTFVCDGYQNNNYFHFNWGWGGRADGYYYIGSLNPQGLNFNREQSIIVNICPSKPPLGYNGFSLGTNSLLLTANQSTNPVTLISSVNWTVSSNQSWIRLNSNSGTAGSISLDVIAEANSTENSRSAIVTVSTTEFGSQTLIVKQPAKITTTAGNLRNILVGKLDEMKSITLAGTIDARDFKTMRNDMPMLESIDLSNTSILEYDGTDGTYDNHYKMYNANAIPGYALKTNFDTITSNLHKFVFPLNTITIDSFAFNRCATYSTFDIPVPVRNIKRSSFQSCWFLTGVNVPATVKSIEFGAFDDCGKLQEINVDKNNDDYSSNDGVLFDKNQTSLIKCPPSKQGNYIVPTTTTEIKYFAFESCTFSSINIPISVDSISYGAFALGGASIAVDVNNPKYSSNDGVLYNKNQTELLFSPRSKTGNFIIPQGIKSIGELAFYGCYLTSATIPTSVTSIREQAFNSSHEMVSVEIPSSIISIGRLAFFNCSKLSTVKIPASVNFIGDRAFSLCVKLTSITVGRRIPVKLNTDVFSNSNMENCTLEVPYGSKGAYQTADQWKDFKNIVEATNGFSLGAATANIASTAGSTTNVELKANVSWTASSDKSWLTLSTNFGTTNETLLLTAEANTSVAPRIATITVSATGYDSQTVVVTQSGSGTVLNVTAGNLSSILTDLELSLIPKLILAGTIDARDFKTMRDKMPLLEDVDLSKVSISAYSGAEGTHYVNNSWMYDANTVPMSAFFMKDWKWKGKESLTSITLPTSLTIINWSAFRDCDGLTSFSIPSSVVGIDSYVFMDCDGLKSIEIPSTVGSIGSGVFENCTNLSSIKVYRTVPVDFLKTASTDVFTGVNKNTCILSVPYGSKAAYQAADQWKDFVNIVEELPTGLQFIDMTSIKVATYDGKLTIENVEPGSTLQVFTASGVKVKEQKLGSTNSTLSLPSGVYVLRIGNYSKKIVIK